MRSSPWVSLALILPFMGGAFWAIFAMSSPQGVPKVKPSSGVDMPSSSTESLEVELVLQASDGLVWLSLEEPISGWKRVFSQENGTLNGQGELDLGSELTLPFAGEVEVFVDARWQGVVPQSKLALSLGMILEGDFNKKEQTFWTQAKESGEGELSFETWQLYLP